MKPLALLALAAASCNQPAGVTALYDTSPTRDDFFALPWPSDARIKDGKLDLAGFHLPDPPGIIGEYVTAISSEPLGGFGTHAAIFFRFDGALDPASLPQTPADSIADGASVFVAEKASGKKSPVRVRFTADAGNYIGTNWLALLPEPGFPLREKTTYVATVTNKVKAADGGPVRRARTFTASDPTVVVSTEFTTQDATSIMKQLRDAVYAQAPAPTVANLQWIGVKPNLYNQYEGMYDSPNFQEGDPPYTRTGGHIHLGSDGKPLVVRTEHLRFALTVPTTPMPPDGWPVVLYAHGTGGDFTSFIGDGSAADAASVEDDMGATIGHLAMISIDQVLHGPRDPTMSDPDLTFFNVQNIVAARDNPKQGALDDFQLVRFVEGFSVDMAPMTNLPIKFDKSRIYFKGHSQGGLTGPLFLAHEPDVKAAILSGAGADLIFGLLGKKQPVDVPALVEAIVNEPVDEYHPLLSLAQTYLESSDPGNYARLFFREPPDGLAPKSIYQSLGIVDHYTPIPTIKALGLAMGVQPVNPELDPIDDVALAGTRWADAPLQNNAPGGAASGVLCEYQVPLNAKGMQQYDGHFVVFNDPRAIVQSNGFLATHAATGIARLLP